MGYADSALEGEVITFTCPPGQLLNGTDTSTCMGNGEWEPDISEMNCIGLLALYALTAAIFYAQTHQFHCKLAIHFDYLTVMSGATLTTALISVTCVLVVISVLTFVIGFICGQCYVRKKASAANSNKNAEPSNTGPANEQVGDLELKENVAYVTLCPK